MALLKINEPHEKQSSAKSRIAAGIDLGTTHSLVATLKDGKVTVIADDQGNEIIPSVVFYGEGETLIGHKALEKKERVSPLYAQLRQANDGEKL